MHGVRHLCSVPRRDLRAAEVDFLTLGQYLRPSAKHAPVREYVTLGGFVTDVLYPGTVRDDFEVDFKLKKTPKLTEEQLNARVQELAEAAARLRGAARRASEKAGH